MKIFCKAEGCQSSIDAPEPVGYLCRVHTPDTINTSLAFQDTAFDPEIGSGSDPRAYERGQGHFDPGYYRKWATQESTAEPKESPVFKYGKVKVKKLLIEAKAQLEGHENAEEILAILNEDIRDYNSGVTKDE